MEGQLEDYVYLRNGIRGRLEDRCERGRPSVTRVSYSRAEPG